MNSITEPTVKPAADPIESFLDREYSAGFTVGSVMEFIWIGSM